MLGEVVLPLVIELLSMSIFLTEGNVDIEVLEGNAEGNVKNLFATTLLGATIQDGGTRARSSGPQVLWCTGTLTILFCFYLFFLI